MPGDKSIIYRHGYVTSRLEFKTSMDGASFNNASPIIWIKCLGMVRNFDI